MRRLRLRRRRGRKDIESFGPRTPLKAIVPNLITSMAACAGIVSISLSSEGRFTHALMALLFACVCDGMDGRIARLLKASSRLGAELDSLADFVNFGVAPAMFMYFWLTGGPGHDGFDPRTVRLVLGASLFYALCDCFRLARFNTMLEQPPLPYWKHFFTGVPAPGGCWLVLTPAILCIALEARDCLPAVESLLRNPVFGSFILFAIGSLMASRLPTISLKALHFKNRRQARLFLAVALLAIALLFADLWLTLGIGGVLYLASIPLTCAKFLSARAGYEAAKGNP